MGTGSEHQAVLYAAKSTEDKRGSIPGQLADCRAFAAESGLEVIDEYSEADVSAYKGNRGPELAAALAHVEELGGTLVVQHSDRLARGDGKQARHLVEVALWARRVGVRIHCVQDPSTFENVVLAAVMGERNMEDSRRKSMAVRAGIARRRLNGRLHGPHPYGYVWRRDPDDEREIVPDPGQAEIVRRIYSEFLSGRPQLQIARKLNAARIRTARGGRWGAEAIRLILMNPTYAGLIRVDGHLIEARHPPIVSRRRWDKAQEIRVARATVRQRGRTTIGPHLFRKGLLRCRACGASFVPRSEQNRDGSLYEVYRCHGRIRNPAFCSVPPQRRAQIDAAVYRALEDVHLDFGPASAEVFATLRSRADEVRELLSQSARQADLASERLDRVTADYVDGSITPDEWREVRVDLEPEKTSACAERDRLEAQLVTLETGPDLTGIEGEIRQKLTELAAAMSRPRETGEDVSVVRDALIQIFERFDLEVRRDGVRIEPVARSIQLQGYELELRPRLAAASSGFGRCIEVEKRTERGTGYV